MNKVLIAAAAILALAGCQRRAEMGPNGQVTIHGDNGQTVTVGRQTPTNLPAYAPIFPGAQVVSTLGSSAGGGVVVLMTHATPTDIASFYAKAATGAGLSQTLDSASTQPDGRTRMIIYGQTGSKRSLAVTIEPQADGATKIGLLYGAA